jgi:hypothetical protein
MEVVGYLPFQAFPPKRKEKDSPTFNQFLRQRGELSRLKSINGFHQIFRKTSAENTSVMKYDREYIDGSLLDSDAQRKSDEVVDIVFQPLYGTCRIFEQYEITYDGTKSPGVPYVWMGCRTKLQAVRKFLSHAEYFWYNAHKLDIPVFWRVSGKEEMLPIEKTSVDDIRTFMFPPWTYHFYGYRMYDMQNEMFKNKLWSPMWPFFVGFDKHHGGYNRLAEILNRFDFKREGDSRRWDASMAQLLFDTVKRVRWNMYIPSCQTPENKQRHDYFYKNIVFSLLLMATGQVLRKKGGNPSGSPNTTYDNCMGHLKVKAYSYFRTFPDHEPLDFLTKVFSAMYADDYLDAMLRSIASTWTHEAAIRGYAEWGVVLKPNHVESENLNGLTFLGCAFEHHESDGWVPVFPRERALCALRWNARKYGVYDDLIIAESMYREAFYTSERNFFRDYMIYCRDKVLTDVSRTQSLERCPLRLRGQIISLIHGLPSEKEVSKGYTGYE